MRILVIFWSVVYLLMAVVIGAAYLAQNQPAFEADAAILTRDNAAEIGVLGRLSTSSSNVPYFDPDQRLIMVGSSRVMVYDMTNGNRLGRLNTNPDCGEWSRVFGCFDTFSYYNTLHAISDDGRYLAISGYQFAAQSVRVWDLRNADLVETLTLNNTANVLVTFFPNSHELIYHDPLKGLWRYNAETRLIHQIDTEEPRQIVHHGADTLYYLTINNDLKVIGPDFVPRILETGVSTQGKIIISPDERWLVSQNPDWALRLDDLVTDEFHLLAGHAWTIHDMVFSPDGRYLFSSTAANSAGSRTLIQWSMEPLEMMHTLPLGGSSELNLAISPNGEVLFAASWGRLAAWDVETGERLLNIPTDDTYSVGRIYISPDGRFLINESGRVYGVPR